jgi:hypothetical protein
MIEMITSGGMIGPRIASAAPGMPPRPVPGQNGCVDAHRTGERRDCEMRDRDHVEHIVLFQPAQLIDEFARFIK